MLAAFEFPPVSHLFVWEEVLFEDTPFAVNKVVVLTGLAAALAIGFFFLGSRKKALVPSGMQNLAEMGYGIVEESIAVEVMGPVDGKRWTPFLTSLFFYIFFMNIFEVIPVIQFPPTARIGIPMFLALMVWTLMIVVGFVKQGPRYITSSLFPPGVPKPLYVLVTPIEFVSKFLVRPFSHTVRLFANMMAGHILLTTFALMSAALFLAKWNVIFLPLPFAMGVAMTGFEILVAVLQAYIFTILAAVYIGESIHPEH